MTFISEDHNVLKSDDRGRVSVPVERGEALLDEFKRSGFSGVKFAALAGVKYPTLRRCSLCAKAAQGAQHGSGQGGQINIATHAARPIRLFVAGPSWSAPWVDSGLALESPSQLRLTVELSLVSPPLVALSLVGFPNGRSFLETLPRILTSFVETLGSGPPFVL